MLYDQHVHSNKNTVPWDPLTLIHIIELKGCQIQDINEGVCMQLATEFLKGYGKKCFLRLPLPINYFP